MSSRALVAAVAAALLAAGPAAASNRDLPPVCAAGCVAAKPGTGSLFLFSGHGWGHGIGMSQYGAWGYALHGWSYQQILSHYYPGTTIGPAQTNLVRVLLADGRKSLKVSCTVPFSVTDGVGVSHSLAAGTVTLGPKLVVAGQMLPPPLTFNAGPGGWMTLAHAYRGQIQVDVVDGRLRAINVVGLEDYLYGVVPAEMPSSWPVAALEAQAVASRSYALATRKIAAPFDVYGDTRSQVYLGVSHEAPATNAAVDATKGQVAIYDGKVASTFFSASSGGATESIASAWGVAPLPYLVSVPDPYDVLSPYHNWGPVAISAKTFANALKVKTSILDLQTTLDPAGRVSRVSVVNLPSLALGSTVSPSFAGGTVSGALGLRSTWFSVSMMSLQQPAPATPIAFGSPLTLTGLVRGITGVSLEQRAFGGSWTLVGPVTPAPDGSLVLPESPAVTTDYRLATSAAAVGYVRVRVAPAVQASESSGVVSGTEQPTLPGAPVEVDVQNPDLSWTAIATGGVAADGTFVVPAALPAGATYRVLVTPGQGFAPGASAPQIATG
jgi:stage II sporulation protein D